jgi:hypothetical protein
MWEPRRLRTLWAFTACYRDSFTFLRGALVSFEDVIGLWKADSGHLLLGVFVIASCDTEIQYETLM